MSEEDAELFESIKETLYHRVRPMLQVRETDASLSSVAAVAAAAVAAAAALPTASVSLQQQQQQLLLVLLLPYLHMFFSLCLSLLCCPLALHAPSCPASSSLFVCLCLSLILVVFLSVGLHFTFCMQKNVFYVFREMEGIWRSCALTGRVVSCTSTFLAAVRDAHRLP